MSENPKTVVDLLEDTVRHASSKIAIAHYEGSITYAELNKRCRCVASSISRITTGNTVAIYFTMSPEFVITFMGAVLAGKRVLPLNTLLPVNDLKLILKDSGASVVITATENVKKIQPVELPVHSYTDLLVDAAREPISKPKPDDVCALLYTSGTTGTPKGVMLTHLNLASNASTAARALRISAQNRFLACLPTFHSLAITGTMLAPIYAEASIVTLPKFDAETVLGLVSGLKCDVLAMVPSMYRVLARMQERHPREMQHLSLAIAGAEPLSEEIRTQFKQVFNVDLLDGYGQTESSPVIALNLPWANKPGSVGKPLEGVQLRIVDPDSNQDMQPDGVGEVWARGPNIMQGYLNRPEENAKTLVPGGWLRTGDMGAVDRDGYLRITGRLREMIKVGGEMVFPAEIEKVLMTHAAVAEVVVTGVKDERAGEIIKAFVVLKPGANATEEVLLQHCRATLPPYKVPRQIEFRPDLPKGPTGKVMRRLLTEGEKPKLALINSRFCRDMVSVSHTHAMLYE